MFIWRRVSNFSCHGIFSVKASLYTHWQEQLLQQSKVSEWKMWIERRRTSVTSKELSDIMMMISVGCQRWRRQQGCFGGVIWWLFIRSYRQHKQRLLMGLLFFKWSYSKIENYLYILPFWRIAAAATRSKPRCNS